jgi:hypothetical protein
VSAIRQHEVDTHQFVFDSEEPTEDFIEKTSAGAERDSATSVKLRVSSRNIRKLELIESKGDSAGPLAGRDVRC